MFFPLLSLHSIRREGDGKQKNKTIILTFRWSLVENHLELLGDTNEIFVGCKMVYKYKVDFCCLTFDDLYFALSV